MLLLDTHALLWLDSGAPMSARALPPSTMRPGEARSWSRPCRPGRSGCWCKRAGSVLDLEPLPWFERFLGLPGVRLTPLSVAAAISSSFLHEPFHGDPADRLLVATARTLPATLITRDARILSYAEAGHLRALAC